MKDSHSVSSPTNSWTSAYSITLSDVIPMIEIALRNHTLGMFINVLGASLEPTDFYQISYTHFCTWHLKKTIYKLILRDKANFKKFS